MTNNRKHLGWFSPDGGLFLDMDLITVCIWSQNDNDEETLFVRLQGMEDLRIDDLELDEDQGTALMRALSEYRGYPGYTNPGRDV